MTNETTGRKMNGRAQNRPATGSHVDVVRKEKPNRRIANDEPRASCQPTRKTSTTTASAIASVSHSNALSPKRDGGFILAASDLPAIAGASRLEALGMTDFSVQPPYILISSTRFSTPSRNCAASGA